MRRTTTRTIAWLRAKPIRYAYVAGGAVAVILLVWIFAGSSGSQAEQLASSKSQAELKDAVKANPSDATQHLALGHSYFADGKRTQALDEYERALELDKTITDGKLVHNLAATFGKSNEQAMAAVLIVRYKLVQIEDELADLVTDSRYAVRWPAFYTLEKLGRAKPAYEVGALRVDLRSKNCQLMRHAVTRLVEIGDASVIDDLREAGKQEKQCLAQRTVVAEKQLLARRDR